ncbi:hypothetical protein [Glaciecola sp. 1036]|uniref:hypothetical protein n=1 Tax=Alteromonadaceae TaxID=72275 RepID=UPI003D053C68
MKLLEAAQEILALEPLPDDAPKRLQELSDAAEGEEQFQIDMLLEAMHESASIEQLMKWMESDNGRN